MLSDTRRRAGMKAVSAEVRLCIRAPGHGQSAIMKSIGFGSRGARLCLAAWPAACLGGGRWVAEIHETQEIALNISHGSFLYGNSVLLWA